MNPDYSGIAGLEGREPVGAVLTIGVKSEGGFPTEKDRFHIVWPQENEAKIRPLHPQFAPFNSAPVERRIAIVCQIVHATREQCFEHSYRCQSAANQPAHPAKVPFCVGNGVRARRFAGGDVFNDIVCPAEKCEFRQPIKVGDREKPAPCKPWMRLLFRPIWSDKSPLPSPVMKFTSGSWNTIRNMLGLFGAWEQQARAVGLHSYSLIGLRFTMQLTEQKNAEKKSRFPVVRVVPLDDPIAFFEAQAERRERFQRLGELPATTPAALTDRSQTDPAEEAADRGSHTPGGGQ